LDCGKVEGFCFFNFYLAKGLHSSFIEAVKPLDEVV
jgi:hypothetical protein